jgi:WXXGXW repeat (2 copies)
MRTIKSLGLLVLMGLVLVLAMPSASQAQIAVGISVHVGPPALPVYAQPICPGPGYIWTPGYWAYGDDGYYWVPGTWVLAPEPGLLWTPGYWGWGGGVYVWHAGYWGPHVGFYGGINYGFGYTGSGFWGGEWRGREFVYNRSVTNVNVTVIHNYYNKTVVVNNVSHVSFNGGEGGVRARPTHDEERWAHERHVEARHEQIEHERAARADRSLRASENHGRPAIAATGRPGDFHGHNVVAARDEHRDRPDNRNVGHNDRPDDRNFGRNDRAESRPTSVRSNDRPDPRGEARGNPHTQDRGPAPHGEARGNPHVDRAPETHGNPHGGAAHDNKPAHENKNEHGKEKP